MKISQERRSIESEVEAYTSEFLTENDFDDENPIIMEFISIKSNSQEYQDKIYMTSIDEINREPHGQKIAIVTGFDPTHLSINAINYVQVLLGVFRLGIALERSIPRSSEQKKKSPHSLTM